MEAANENAGLAVAESVITIGNVRFKVKSVFADKVKLEDALKNIAIKKQKDGSLQKAS